jgi:PD-(D/E)XK endonuclease
MLTSDQKGAIAELEIASAAIELGIGVSRPLSPQRYDLIFDVAGDLLRVQCKWATRQGDVVGVCCYSARRNAEGLVRRRYKTAEVDAFAAYCADLRRAYFLPFGDVPPGGSVYLRLAPACNRQERRIRWASAYEFAATLRREQGAIAQLGERRAGSAKVTGSSPVGSMT